jgi:SAM-dependent methyltransferase
MRADYADIFQSTENVDKYTEVVYAPGSYASHVNTRQRAFIRDLVTRTYRERRPVQHDFACGTGRAIRLLHGLVRSAHGYDPSAEMLAKATEAGTRATLHQIPASGELPVPATETVGLSPREATETVGLSPREATEAVGLSPREATEAVGLSPREATGTGPALVTMFRLLLNVPEDVRERAIAFAATALPTADAGLLVVENHGNRQSLRHLAARRHAGDPWFSELSHASVVELFERHGFELVEARAFALFPAGAYRSFLRPIARVVDDLVVRLPFLWRWGTDVLYVARRR